MKSILKDKKRAGIVWAVIIEAAFAGISLTVANFLSGVSWFIFSSVLRIVFGIAILKLIGKVFGKPPKELFAFCNTRTAVISGMGFLLYFVYYLIAYAAGFERFTEISAGIVFGRIFLQQIATGFYEEMHYRALILEGYNYGKKNVGRKIIYALISFVLFGSIHVLTGWDTYTFLRTGAIGFAFAAIYLNSGNIIIPMILHFVYDIFPNLSGYIKWNDSELFTELNDFFAAALLVMFIVSFVLLFKKETEKQDINNLCTGVDLKL
ncbi:MAG: CPBP family intramembrane metalloprotease [Ruminococcus sp.]|nr:CPBP family intramembrane metalloprotease [Ruminococcus sp.]